MRSRRFICPSGQMSRIIPGFNVYTLCKVNGEKYSISLPETVSLGGNTIQNLHTGSLLFIFQLSVSENEVLDISELNSSSLQKTFCLPSEVGLRIILHQRALTTCFQLLEMT